MEEIWEKSSTAENYEVSNLGNIRHLERKINLKLRDNGNGYKVIGIRVNGKGKNYYVHRLVAQVFIPNPENKPQINHIDGNKENNRIGNLEWCTSSYNLKHSYKKGLKKPSEKQKNAARINIANMSEESKLKSLINRTKALSLKTRKDRQLWAIPLCKPIKCVELNRVFISVIRASEKLNIGYAGIYNCLNGKSKTSSGYHWKYLKLKEREEKCL